ncbi:MAG: hypothetical protein HYX53_03480 [Chloroflexi bacterium]|nr:hypothetical protein [Chloroflexota bacterium]
MTPPLQLAAVEPTGRLATYSLAGERRERSDTGANALWPAWNPVHDLIAASILTPRAGGVRSTVETVIPGTGARTLLFEVPEGAPPVIAPRVPHYCMWSPDGEWLSVVAPGADGLTLSLVRRDGSDSVTSVAVGAPLFAAWSGDSRLLAVHAGAELVLFDVAAGGGQTSISDRAAGFRTPAFSPRGDELIFVVPGDPGALLVAAGLQGGQRQLARLPGAAAFMRRPGTTELTLAVSQHPEGGAFDTILNLDLERSEKPRLLARGPVAAMAWSPAGDRLATFAPSHFADGRFAIHLRDPDGRTVAATEAFFPSVDTRTSLAFFDQYRLSHPGWSPDGSLFVSCGRLPGDGVSASLGDATDRLLVWKASPREPFVVAEPAEFACLAPPGVAAE